MIGIDGLYRLAVLLVKVEALRECINRINTPVWPDHFKAQRIVAMFGTRRLHLPISEWLIEACDLNWSGVRLSGEAPFENDHRAGEFVLGRWAGTTPDSGTRREHPEKDSCHDSREYRIAPLTRPGQ
jgi:hypothetical protein